MRQTQAAATFPTDTLSLVLEMLLWLETKAHLRIDNTKLEAQRHFHATTNPAMACHLPAALALLRSLLPSAAAEWAKPSGSAAAHLPAWRVEPSIAYIFKPRASVSTGARICGCSDTLFFSCFIAISALNMRETRAQHKSSDFASTAAEHLNMHETRATATFAFCLATPTHSGLRFCMFGSRRALLHLYL